MGDAPRFSVTIPAYNASATLAETVASVLVQSFGDFEIVIVDDGSTDDTLELARELATRDGRIRVVTQENRGSGGAYNTAVKSARSDLLVMLSADDLLLPDHLARFDRFVADHGDAAIFTSGGYYEYEDGSREQVGRIGTWADPGGCSLAELFSACFFGVGAVYRREVFDAVGGFAEDLYAEDYLFWLQALAKGYRHRYLDEALAVHRRNSAQKSADAIRMRQADVVVVGRLLASGDLSGPDAAAARRSLSRLRRNLRMRKVLVSVLGQERSAALIDRVRGRGRS